MSRHSVSGDSIHSDSKPGRRCYQHRRPLFYLVPIVAHPCGRANCALSIRVNKKRRTCPDDGLCSPSVYCLDSSLRTFALLRYDNRVARKTPRRNRQFDHSFYRPTAAYPHPSRTLVEGLRPSHPPTPMNATPNRRPDALAAKPDASMATRPQWRDIAVLQKSFGRRIHPPQTPV